MIIEANPWTPADVPYGELPVANRARIACISRKYKVLNVLRAETTMGDWIDSLPDPVATQVIKYCNDYS